MTDRAEVGAEVEESGVFLALQEEILLHVIQLDFKKRRRRDGEDRRALQSGVQGRRMSRLVCLQLDEIFADLEQSVLEDPDAVFRLRLDEGDGILPVSRL